MTITAYLALLGWIPIVVVMYALLPHRLASTIAVIGAWLILPPVALSIAGLPDYSKNTAASLGMILGTLLFASDRLSNFRPRWYDLPMLAWCLCGIPSSLQNGLGLYDGLSDVLTQAVTWGLPYLLGRLYFGTPEDLRVFAVAMVVGGLCYVLPCIWEIRMSPQICGQIYGIEGGGEIRMGGWRPHVFFARGLECGMWMTAAALAGWWLWRCRALKQIGPVPFGPVLLPILLVTTILCRSTGALALLFAGIMLLWLSTRLRTRLLLAGLLLVGPVYAGARSTNLWSGRQAVNISEAVAGPARAESLEYRFKCEDQLAARALQQPIFGWGGWGRSRLDYIDDYGVLRQVPTDGMWIIMLGTKGLVGLALFLSILILPALLFVRRFPARMWDDPRLAAGSLAAAFLGLYVVDCLLNGFVNIIYITLAGGLTGLVPMQLRATGGPGRGIEAAGRRSAAGTVRTVPSGIGTANARALSGRVALADRCRTLGRSFKQEGQLDEAEAAWRQALDLLAALRQVDPDAAELRRRWCDCANDLAWLQANHPNPDRRDPVSAVSMARKIVDDCPDAAVYWNTLGAAHYRAGDDRAAIAALEHARALGGGTAFDDVFLAMAHARLGDLEEARKALARAMLQAERDYPGHLELAGLCDEAHSLITGGAAAPAVIG